MGKNARKAIIRAQQASKGGDSAPAGGSGSGPSAGGGASAGRQPGDSAAAPVVNGSSHADEHGRGAAGAAAEAAADVCGGDASAAVEQRLVVRGLANLGNTCFFNSTMQCLASLAPLARYFCREAKPGEGELTASMRRFIVSMRLAVGANAGQALTPSELHSAVVRKAPRFKGYRQQDAQELLRFLLDGISDEEDARLKKVAGIRANLASAGRPALPAAASDADGQASPHAGGAAAPAAGEPTPGAEGDGSASAAAFSASATGDSAAAAGEAGAAAAARAAAPALKIPKNVVLRTFGGRLCSVIVCDACGAASVTQDPFLDLSLQLPQRGSGAGSSAALASAAGYGKPAGKGAKGDKKGFTAAGFLDDGDAFGKGKAKLPPATTPSRKSIGISGVKAGSKAAVAAAATAAARPATAGPGAGADVKKLTKAQLELLALERSLGLKPSVLAPTSTGGKVGGVNPLAGAVGSGTGAAGTADDAAALPAMPDDEIENAPKAALVEWLQRHAPPAVAKKLGIANATAKQCKSIARSALADEVRRLQKQRAQALAAAAALEAATAAAAAPAADGGTAAGAASAGATGQESQPPAQAAAQPPTPEPEPTEDGVPAAEQVGNAAGAADAANGSRRASADAGAEGAPDGSASGGQAAAEEATPDVPMPPAASAASDAPAAADSVLASSTDAAAPEDGAPAARGGEAAAAAPAAPAAPAASDSAADAPPPAEPSASALPAPSGSVVGGYWLPAPLTRDTCTQLADPTSLFSCLAAFTAPEQLRVATGDGYRCERCNAAAAAARAAEQAVPSAVAGSPPPAAAAAGADGASGTVPAGSEPASAAVQGAADSGAALESGVPPSPAPDASAAAAAANDGAPHLADGHAAAANGAAESIPAENGAAPVVPAGEGAPGGNTNGGDATATGDGGNSSSSSDDFEMVPAPGRRGKQAAAAKKAAAGAAAAARPAGGAGGKAVQGPPPVLRDASKRILLMGADLPPVLTIHLKRFAATARGQFQKVADHVAFPEVLDLSAFVAHALPEGEGAPSSSYGPPGGGAASAQGPAADGTPLEAASPQLARADDSDVAAAAGTPVTPPTPVGAPAHPVLYRLTGVVVHSGGLGGGHYIAHVRAGNATEFVHAATGLRLLPDCGTDWYHISDSHAGGGSLAGALAAQAYLLFYERVRTEAEPA